jgi:AhpD family alkylhydroperoxidase
MASSIRRFFTVMINPLEAAPVEMREWIRASLAINSSVEPTLAQLIETRVSQINGCANCINLHATVAREQGETEQRLYLLPAWREAPCYTEAERAALAWTDALTRISEGHDLKTARDGLKAYFTEAEQIRITLAINIINGFNRLAVGFGLWADPAEIRATAAKTAA